MICSVVGVRVTDEDQFFLGPMRIEPKPQVRKINAAFTKLEIQRWHALNLRRETHEAKSGSHQPAPVTETQRMGRLNSMPYCSVATYFFFVALPVRNGSSVKR